MVSVYTVPLWAPGHDEGPVGLAEASAAPKAVKPAVAVRAVARAMRRKRAPGAGRRAVERLDDLDMLSSPFDVSYEASAP